VRAPTPRRPHVAVEPASGGDRPAGFPPRPDRSRGRGHPELGRRRSGAVPGGGEFATTPFGGATDRALLLREQLSPRWIAERLGDRHAAGQDAFDHQSPRRHRVGPGAEARLRPTAAARPPTAAAAAVQTRCMVCPRLFSPAGERAPVILCPRGRFPRRGVLLRNRVRGNGHRVGEGVLGMCQFEADIREQQMPDEAAGRYRTGCRQPGDRPGVVAHRLAGRGYAHELPCAVVKDRGPAAMARIGVVVVVVVGVVVVVVVVNEQSPHTHSPERLRAISSTAAVCLRSCSSTGVSRMRVRYPRAK